MDRTPPSASPSSPCFGSVVVLRGELDLLTAPAADRLLEDAAATHPGCDLLVDLRQVTFADCAGLSPLLRAARRARERGGTVTAMVTAPRLLRLLTLTRITEAVAVLPALDLPADPPRTPTRPTPAGGGAATVAGGRGGGPG
ncbi:STAS domain-containing protein [Streptomyces sp. NPDC092296]|uniref:STAS domain-containing protein n=1 Tax=Streptomyces sp. NPDC092296 TaxID=3366012 RepID=UPI00382B754A